MDGLPSQSFDVTSNRITTAGTEYDKAGNLIRGKAPDGSWQRFEYDTAGRLVKIKADNGTLLEEYTYGASRERLRKEANNQRTYYAWGGSSVLMEYFETTTALTWAKSYIYAGSRLLSTITNTAGSEVTEYHHPDRLGTRLITNPVGATQVEQNTLPFGTSIDAETSGTSNQRFTSYDRSGTTGLDYAMNRTYNSGQSRFTQVDPIGMASASIGNPQSLNMFAYVQNNPIDFTDPIGLLMAQPNIGRFIVTIQISWWERQWDSYWGADNGWSSGWDTGRRTPRDPGEGIGGSRGDGLPEYARRVYIDLGEKLTDCINKVFAKEITGKNGKKATGANLLKGQKIANAPRVNDTKYSAYELGGGTGTRYSGYSFPGDENRGPNGTVWIANDLGAVYGSSNNEISSQYDQYQRTYVHELGNKLSREISQNGSARTFGDPKSSDKDTGYQLEKCVYGNVITAF